MTPESERPDDGMVSRALAAQAVMGILATLFAGVKYGGFSAQSVAFGAAFAGLHLYSAARSVRAVYGGEIAAARFFVLLRSLRFMTLLAAAAWVLVLGLASGLGFLAGYVLLVPAIASAPFTRRLGRKS